MIDQWTADVITKLRMLGISQKEFAKICGYSEPYMSQVRASWLITARKLINMVSISSREEDISLWEVENNEEGEEKENL